MFGHMITITFVVVAALLSVLVAWLVNLVVGWMSGEHPKDTPHQSVDVFLQLFHDSYLGFVGTLFDWSRCPTWLRLVFYLIAGVCVLLTFTQVI